MDGWKTDLQIIFKFKRKRFYVARGLSRNLVDLSEFNPHIPELHEIHETKSLSDREVCVRKRSDPSFTI